MSLVVTVQNIQEWQIGLRWGSIPAMVAVDIKANLKVASERILDTLADEFAPGGGRSHKWHDLGGMYQGFKSPSAMRISTSPGGDVNVDIFDATYYGKFIRHPSRGSRGDFLPAVYAWAVRKLKKDHENAFRIAKYVAEHGAGFSAASPLRTSAYPPGGIGFNYIDWVMDSQENPVVGGYIKFLDVFMAEGYKGLIESVFP